MKARIGLLIAAALVFSPALLAGAKVCPMPRPPTPESYTWNFPAEVTDLLRDIERDARTVSESAATLEAFVRFPSMISEVSHATELDYTKVHINRMADKLCRLLEIRRVAEPWQQKTVDELEVTLAALATDAELAMEFLGDRSRLTNLADPVYAEYLAGIYREADSLKRVSEITWREQ